MIGLFKDKQLYIELRPRCPKCQKEFMLDLSKFTAGGAHSCHACGTVTQFDAARRRKCRNSSMTSRTQYATSSTALPLNKV